MTIYFLSSLGADSRAFKFLTIPANVKQVFLDWLEPNKNETLQNYAKRVAENIDTSVPFMVVGLSFGGILATELLEFVNPQKIILISSISRRQELPLHYKLAGLLHLNKLTFSKSTNKSNAIAYWLFGITGKNDKLHINEILTCYNKNFSKWAINEILNWQRIISLNHIIRIHGENDKVFPIINFTPNYLIKDGGHFMIINKASEISRILKKEIDSNGISIS